MVISRGDKSSDLRQAFQFEVRPEVYMQRVWWTAAVVAVGLVGQLTYRNGGFVVDLVAPVAGWHARGPEGALYMEVWANILASALQVGFGVWAGWLVLLGLGRLVVSRRLVKACFTMGVAFAVVAAVVPYVVAFGFQWLIQKYPGLGA